MIPIHFPISIHVGLTLSCPGPLTALCKVPVNATESERGGEVIDRLLVVGSMKEISFQLPQKRTGKISAIEGGQHTVPDS